MKSCYFLGLTLLLLLSARVNAGTETETDTGRSSTMGVDKGSFALEYLRESTILPNDDWLQNLSSEISENCPDKRKDAEFVFGSAFNRCVENETKSLEVDLRNVLIETRSKNKFEISEHHIETVSRMTCRLNSVAQMCFEHIIELAAECAPAKGVRSIAMRHNTVMHFLCGDSNTGENLALLMSPSVDQCFGAHKSEIQNCISSEDKKSTDDIVPEPEPEPEQNRTCRSFTRIYRCTHSSLRKCRDPAIDHLFSTLIKIIQNSTEECGLLVIDSSASFTGTGGPSLSLLPLFVANVLSTYFLYNLE